MAVKCCRGCVAPKRYPGCHDHCPEYIADKAEHERLKAIHDREREVNNGIYANRSRKVYRAMRDREQAKKAKW
jgi:hypothetical protein